MSVHASISPYDILPYKDALPLHTLSVTSRMKWLILLTLVGRVMLAPNAFPNLSKVATTVAAKAPSALNNLAGLTEIVKTLVPGREDAYYLVNLKIFNRILY